MRTSRLWVSVLTQILALFLAGSAPATGQISSRAIFRYSDLPIGCDNRIDSRLHTAGMSIYDERGCPVTLNSINVSGLEYGHGQADDTARDGITGYIKPSESLYDRIARFGFNVVRLPVSWANIEPQAPVADGHGSYSHDYNQQYLDTVDEIIGEFGKRGVAVIVSFHQCGWSSRFPFSSKAGSTSGSTKHGYGMPRWLFGADLAKETAALPEGQQAEVQKRLSRRWFFAPYHDPVPSGATPERTDAQQWAAEALSQIVRRHANPDRSPSDNHLIGVDLFNEPSPEYKDPHFAADGVSAIRSLYRRLAAEVRRRHNGLLLVIQDVIHDAGDLPLDGLPLRRSGRPFRNLVYSSHIYTPEWNEADTAWVTDRARWAAGQNRGRGVPFWIGEFGPSPAWQRMSEVGRTGWQEKTRQQLQQWRRLEVRLGDQSRPVAVNWSFWSYQLAIPSVGGPTGESLDFDLLATLQSGMAQIPQPPTNLAEPQVKPVDVRPKYQYRTGTWLETDGGKWMDCADEQPGCNPDSTQQHDCTETYLVCKFEWLRISPESGAATVIADAAYRKYRLTDDDVGFQIISRVRVTGRAPTGPTESAATPAIEGQQ